MDRLLLLRILIVVLLVAANAFFVASEFALVSVRETRIRRLIEQGNFAARSVLRLHNQLDQVLAAVQLGVTLASLALGWVGEPVIAQVVERNLSGLPHAVLFAHAIAVVIAFTLITYVTVILGEIVPKQLSLHRADRVALAIAPPMEFFIQTTRPFLLIMSRSARLVLDLFNIPIVREGGVHSGEELKMVVTASRRRGILPEIQESIVRRAIDIGEVTAREIMTPRQHVFALPADMPLEEAEVKIVDEQHSRVPVYDPAVGPEQVIGLLYAKDVARFMQRRLMTQVQSGPKIPLTARHVMRDVMVVPETKPVLELLQEFKERRRELAAVVDEFGTTAGIVTVEDILEQLVGEIEDEFDLAEAPRVFHATGGVVVLDGAETVRDLDAQMQIQLPVDQGYETLAGFVLAILGHIPLTGESFELDGRRYTVLEMENMRISKIKIEALALDQMS